MRLTYTMILALAALAALPACPEPQSTTCASGRVCPPGTECAAQQDICISNLCGNEIIDPDENEVCDDGNVLDGDGCSANCRSDETCGNGKVDTTVGEV